MICSSDSPGRAKRGVSAPAGRLVPQVEPAKGRVLLVEDEEVLREAISLVLDGAGYEVSAANNGIEALRRLQTQDPPDVILLDLRMPVMDGWEFRAIQKNDPKLGLIPVVAISADGSAQAAAISAQAYLRKPVEPADLLRAIERVVGERARQMLAQADETERLASLGRLAAAVGHEINNPLTFVLLNLSQSLDDLRPSIRTLDGAAGGSLSRGQVAEVRARLSKVAEMLQDCQVGSERIRETVGNLQRMSGRSEGQSLPLDVHKLIEQSVSMVWNLIRHRARLIRNFANLPLIRGNGTALGQVFLNLLVNAAQSIPEGHAEDNEIRISTTVEAGPGGPEVLVEIGDSGAGIAPEILSHVFEPFFTTKATGQGTGLGLSISRQTVGLHHGRMTVESAPGHGSVFRVFLPVGKSPVPPPAVPPPPRPAAVPRGRILVIDDDPLIGGIIKNVLSREHDTFVVDCASAAFACFERGDPFDLVLCDIMMPDVSGPAFYATLSERWPQLVSRVVFMTGGAFTAETMDFVSTLPTGVLSKPFTAEQLQQLARAHVQKDAE